MEDKEYKKIVDVEIEDAVSIIENFKNKKEDYKLIEDKYLKEIGNLKKAYEIDKDLYLDESVYYLVVLEKY